MILSRNPDTRGHSSLALGELGTLTRFAQADFLTLNLTGVTGYITRTAQGRMATPKAYRHFGMEMQG